MQEYMPQWLHTRAEWRKKRKRIINRLAYEYPNHPLLSYGRGQLVALKGDTDAAIAAFEASIEQDPSFHAAPIALGEYYLSQGYTDEAIALWKKSLRANPLNRVVRHRLHELTKRPDSRVAGAEKSSETLQGKDKPPTISSQTSSSAVWKLPTKRRTLYPKRRIPRSQLPAAFFVGLNEDQVINTHGEPVQILPAAASIPGSTKRLAYGDPIRDAAQVATSEGSEFILGEEGVLGFHKVYSGDINAVVGQPQLSIPLWSVKSLKN